MHRKQNPTLMNRRTLLATAIASLGGFLSGCSIEETENKIAEITGRQPWVPRKSLSLNDLCGHQVRPDSRWKIRAVENAFNDVRLFRGSDAAYISEARSFKLPNHDKIIARGKIFALIVGKNSLTSDYSEAFFTKQPFFDNKMKLKDEFKEYLKVSPIIAAPPHCRNFFQNWTLYRYVKQYEFDNAELIDYDNPDQISSFSKISSFNNSGPNCTRPNRLCLAVREGSYGYDTIDFLYELDDWNYGLSEEHYNRSGRLYDVVVRKHMSPHVTIIMVMSSLALNGLDDIIASLKPNLEACERRKGKPDDLDGWPDHSL